MNEMNTFTSERNNYRRKLIMLVKQYSILWNKSQENYNRNRPQKTQAWLEVSYQLDIPVDKLRRTWENLRDQYRRDLKREMKYGFKSKWRFFNDMDFIRTMVTCKESQNGFTDSDSESEANNDQKAQQLNQTQCSVITTNLTTTTTPTLTIPANAINPEIPPQNVMPFQPILLTKQWQQVNNEVAPPVDIIYANQQNSNSSSTFVTYDQPEPTYELLEYPTNCDSSRDEKSRVVTPAAPPPPSSQVYQCLPKQEPDLELENNITASPNMTEVNITATLNALHTSNAAQDEREFQEPSVSTSCLKRSRMSQDSTDAPTHADTKMSRVQESDIEIKDDDYYFVMSLLPSLRQIPRNRKFPLRLGIMNLIAKDLDEVVKDNNYHT